jgi:hypothetical protein
MFLGENMLFYRTVLVWNDLSASITPEFPVTSTEMIVLVLSNSLPSTDKFWIFQATFTFLHFQGLFEFYVSFKFQLSEKPVDLPLLELPLQAGQRFHRLHLQ